MKLSRINAMSLAKILSAINGALGLLAGIIMAISTLFVVQEPGTTTPLVSFGAIVIFPIMYGILGFASGYFIAFVYNFAASKIGPIEIETN